MAEAWLEAEAIMFGAVDDLLHQTGVSARDIAGVLVVNCSLFNPTSSLSAIAVNHYNTCSRAHHQLQPGQDGLLSIEVANCLFRMGSVAILLSNKRSIEEEEIQVRAGAHGENSQGRRRQQEDGDGTVPSQFTIHNSHMST
uniref:FAE domain-containing protein n=1 Tax=Oryza barthii TaxID=65489 RepID=A0A0D3FUT3_9ORYZ